MYNIFAFSSKKTILRKPIQRRQMAGSNVISALVSILIVLCALIFGQTFKTILAESRQGNLAAGVLGSIVFTFSLTAISNLKMASAAGHGSAAKSGLFECCLALLVGVIASASIHRIAITLCLLFSAVVLFFLVGVSNERYDAADSTRGTAMTSAGVGGGKRKK